MCVCDAAQVGPDDVMRLQNGLCSLKTSATNSMDLGEESTHKIAQKRLDASGYDPRKKSGWLARAVATLGRGYNGLG